MERSEHKSLHEFIPGSGILPLAFLAIKRAAAGLNDFHDRRGAGVTFFLAPAVHLDPVHEFSLFGFRLFYLDFYSFLPVPSTLVMLCTSRLIKCVDSG